jgi:hypothetical protein
MHELSRKLAEFSRAFPECPLLPAVESTCGWWPVLRVISSLCSILSHLTRFTRKRDGPLAYHQRAGRKFCDSRGRDSKTISWPLDTLPFNLTWRTTFLCKSFKRANRSWGKSDSDGPLDEGYFAILHVGASWTEIRWVRAIISYFRMACFTSQCRHWYMGHAGIGGCVLKRGATLNRTDTFDRAFTLISHYFRFTERRKRSHKFRSFDAQKKHASISLKVKCW